jgi:hypothetical protein
MQYETRFLINWPEHLGGGFIHLDLEGTMVLAPQLATFRHIPLLP